MSECQATQVCGEEVFCWAGLMGYVGHELFLSGLPNYAF